MSKTRLLLLLKQRILRHAAITLKKRTHAALFSGTAWVLYICPILFKSAGCALRYVFSKTPVKQNHCRSNLIREPGEPCISRNNIYNADLNARVRISSIINKSNLKPL